MESLKDCFPTKLRVILDGLVAEGAQVFIVGGCVRDYLLQKEMKDFDIEVFHLTEQELENVLKRFGDCFTVGKSFGIMQSSYYPMADFALPRKERKKGAGHQGFDIAIDSWLEVKEAMRRRDITINAIYYDYNRDGLVDEFNGIKDLQKGIIRVVDPISFGEDPLRVLRVAQFLSRLNFDVDDECLDICRQMVSKHELDTLSKERIATEYNKLLMGKKPSKGLSFLSQIGGLPQILSDLSNIEQPPQYHPEGDALTHTFLVVDEAAKVKDLTSWPLGFMWSALLHDIGKAKTTDEFGHAYQHEAVGAKLAKEYLAQEHKNRQLERYVESMIFNHMKLMIYASGQAKDKTFLKLLAQINGKTNLNDLYYLTQSDLMGCRRDISEDLLKLRTYIQNKVSRLGDKAPEPLITGNDLLVEGFLAGPSMKEMLTLAYDLQLGGYKKDGILKILRKEICNGTRKLGN